MLCGSGTLQRILQSSKRRPMFGARRLPPSQSLMIERRLIRCMSLRFAANSTNGLQFHSRHAVMVAHRHAVLRYWSIRLPKVLWAA
jgi:hypothetical protein